MMDGFSTVDGFVEVNESLVEMIKYVANEPSVGLYYIQQHTHSALPNLLHLQNRVVGRTRETTLHTEDLEESITMVDSMKTCGLSITRDMISDINRSLSLISTSQQRKGLTHASSSGSLDGKSSNSRGSSPLGRNPAFTAQDAKSTGSYFSAVLNSAKQKAVSIKWPQLAPEEAIGNKRDQLPSNQSLDEAVRSAVSTLPDTETETDELPSSSQILGEQLETHLTNDLLSVSENFEEYKANKEAKLKEWLEEHEDPTK